MTHNQFIERAIEILQDPEMTFVMGTAVALGVMYACVAPWFYCKPNKPEEELQARTNQESDGDVSSTNQTLTSTNIRITGLRGLNFVSITVPNRPSVLGTTGHSSEAPSRIRTSIQHLDNDEKSMKNPLITHPDMTERSTIPEIHISSASTDTTMYPLSSKTSSNLLTAVKSSRRHRTISTDSNNSRYDVIRSHDVDKQNFGIRRVSQLKVRKPPRAHLSNSHKSHDSIRHNRDSSSSSKTLGKVERMHEKSLDGNEISTASHFIERRDSKNFLKKSEIVEDKSLSDQQRQHSLYPDVNVVVRTNSSSTTFPSSSNIHQDSGDVIQRQDLIAKYSPSNKKIIESHLSLTDEFSSTVENVEIISEKSRNKSAFSNFFKKKCKKFWINVNKNNCENAMKSKCSIESVTKNNPTGHSTPIEKSNLSGEVQGHLNQFKYKSGIRRESEGDYHDENSNANTGRNLHKRVYVSQRIPCCFTPNFHETSQPINTPLTLSNICSDVETINHRSLPFRTNFECIDDEPIDLSTKSRENQANINTDKDNNNNCTSEPSFMFSFKKRTNFIFTKTFNKKLYTKKKNRSLPERDETNILKSISQFCHRSHQNKNETLRTHMSDSTHYPELRSMNDRRSISSPEFLDN